MEKAIKLAVEGGYNAVNCNLTVGEYNLLHKGLRWQIYCYNPLFWQCLGKKLDWENQLTHVWSESDKPDWLKNWHKLIDHLASGGNAEEYFTSLTKSND